MQKAKSTTKRGTIITKVTVFLTPRSTSSQSISKKWTSERRPIIAHDGGAKYGVSAA
jgi:hypothetical protein